MDARPSTPEIVCLQCGDVGFKNAFVFCVKCLEFAVHRYCLQIIPKSFDEFVPWVCNDCEAGERNQHPLRKNEAIRFKTRDHTTSEHNLGYSETGIVEEPVYEGGLPRSYDACAKIVLVECSESDSDSHLVGLGMDDQVVVLSAADERKICEQSSSELHEEDKIKDNLIFNELSADHSLKSDRSRFYQQHHASYPEINADVPSAANLKDQGHKPLFAQHLKKHKGLDLETQCADMTTERRGIYLSRESKVGKDINLASKDIRHINMSAEPVMVPIWRGSFNIWNNEDDILEAVMAHVSISACQRVHDEAHQFKPVLHLEMLPIFHVWPKSFEKSEPSAGDIALYFFPSERSELVYDDLVDEMVEEELALKAMVQNSKLLVFPSTKLPLSHWRFRGKYYLWGVFREKMLDPPGSRSPSRYNPVIGEDCLDRSGSSEGEVGVAMKKFEGVSPP